MPTIQTLQDVEAGGEMSFATVIVPHETHQVRLPLLALMRSAGSLRLSPLSKEIQTRNARCEFFAV
jgi:hypothetical protein